MIFFRLFKDRAFMRVHGTKVCHCTNCILFAYHPIITQFCLFTNQLLGYKGDSFTSYVYKSDPYCWMSSLVCSCDSVMFSYKQCMKDEESRSNICSYVTGSMQLCWISSNTICHFQVECVQLKERNIICGDSLTVEVSSTLLSLLSC